MLSTSLGRSTADLWDLFAVLLSEPRIWLATGFTPRPTARFEILNRIIQTECVPEDRKKAMKFEK